MTDVFVSYASEDRHRAQQVGEALEACGWSVWWDRKIITGQAYDQAIERELETAKSVVVLWSNASIESEWVKNEAAVASERGVLLPVLIDGVKLPLEFRRKQTADLVDWNGDPSHGGFRALCEGVAATIGSAPLKRPMPRRGPPTRTWTLLTIAAIVLAVGLGIYSMGPWRTTAPVPGSQNGRSETRSPPESKSTSQDAAGPADLVTGTYSGEVVADSKGSSRSDVTVTITKVDRYKVRVTSDYLRLGTIDVTVTRLGDKLVNADGDTVLLLDLNQRPATLDYNPHGELAYRGSKR